MGKVKTSLLNFSEDENIHAKGSSMVKAVNTRRK
jgi:hypothetical protein